MGLLTRLPGSVLTTKEGGGNGKKLALVALLVTALAIVIGRRRRKSSALEEGDDEGIDTIRTDDDADEDAADEAGTELDEADEDEDEADEDTVEVTTGSDRDGDPVVAPFELDSERSLDVFDLVSIVGAAYRAARDEYEDRRTTEA